MSLTHKFASSVISDLFSIWDQPTYPAVPASQFISFGIALLVMSISYSSCEFTAQPGVNDVLPNFDMAQLSQPLTRFDAPNRLLLGSSSSSLREMLRYSVHFQLSLLGLHLFPRGYLPAMLLIFIFLLIISRTSPHAFDNETLEIQDEGPAEGREQQAMDKKLTSM